MPLDWKFIQYVSMSIGRIPFIQLMSGAEAYWGCMYGSVVSSSKKGPLRAGPYTVKTAIRTMAPGRAYLRKLLGGAGAGSGFGAGLATGAVRRVDLLLVFI